MSEALGRVIALASKQSGLPPERMGPASAIYQDLGLGGDDVTEFALNLSRLFGDDVLTWPWSRFTDLNEPTLLDVFAAIARFGRWLIRAEKQRSVPCERLELAHIAAVIENGQWRDP